MKSYGYKNFFNMLPNYESGCHMKFPALYVCELKKQENYFKSIEKIPDQKLNTLCQRLTSLRKLMKTSRAVCLSWSWWRINRDVDDPTPTTPDDSDAAKIKDGLGMKDKRSNKRVYLE